MSKPSPFLPEVITESNASCIELLQTVALAGSAWSVAFAPDGETIAIAKFNCLQIWLVDQGRAQLELTTDVGLIDRVVYSPDGKMLLTSSRKEDRLQLWDTSTGRRIARWHTGLPPVWGSAFNPAGNLIASGSDDGKIRLWRTIDQYPVQMLDAGAYVWDVAFAPDGSALAAALDSGELKLWQVEDWRLLKVLDHSASSITCITYAPAGAVLAAGCSSGEVLLWSLADGSGVIMPNGHEGSVNSVAISSHGDVLASGSDGGELRLWSLDQGGILASLSAGSSAIRSLAFGRSGRLLVGASGDGSVRFWGVRHTR